MPGEVKLQEARNVGEWFEARLHFMFTEIADNMFGEGKLTRDERIALSAAIGGALDAFRANVEEKANQLYSRDLWEEPEEQTQVNAIESGFVPLVEKAVRRDGTIPLKLIKPGWGTTGYYPANVLESDGPKVFRAGTKMFWNHPTAEEEMERPEGDLNALAAELVSDARYDGNGVDGPGLYADAKVFEAYQGPVNDLAPHIGVSIRAMGPAMAGSAEGRQGLIIQGIKMARSVDFVTQPGAGGKIVELFEAARPGRSQKSEVRSQESKGVDMELEKQLKEAQDEIAQLRQANARLQEALALREAGELVAGKLAVSTLPKFAHNRLREALVSRAVIKDGKVDTAAFETVISEAIRSETEYLAQAAGNGQISGMGGQPSQSAAPDVSRRLQESLQALGLSEKSAAGVVNGRSW